MKRLNHNYLLTFGLQAVLLPSAHALTVETLLQQANKEVPVAVTSSEQHANSEAAINFAEIKQALMQAKLAANSAEPGNKFYIDYQAAPLWRWQDDSDNTLQPLNFSGQLNVIKPLLLSGSAELALADNARLSAGYQYGRFSAETGVIHELSDESSGERFYLQGSYQFFSREKFSLSLTAKVESLNNGLSDSYFHPGSDNTLLDFSQGTSLNSTLGIVGKYSLTKKWSVIGAVSSSSFSVDLPDNVLVDSNIAIIGTSYSF